MRSSLVSAVLLSGLLLAGAPFADRDRFVTGATIGVASGRATGGLADHVLIGTLPGAIVIGSSGRCYGWTRSGRLLRVGCP